MGTTTAAPAQRQLFETSRDEKRGAAVVNDRVTVRTSDGHRAVLVDGLVIQHYAVTDRAAEVYAMVTLVECGYADQNDVARAFGCSARTLRRDQGRYDRSGMEALGRPSGRPTGSRASGKRGGLRDRMVSGMKAEGLSNREIGKRLGITEAAVRKRLKRLGWVEPDRQGRLFETELPAETAPATEVVPALIAAAEGGATTAVVSGPAAELPSVAPNPLDRSADRLLAQLGLLSDAEPRFAAAESVPQAGVLLAIPGLVRSGVLEVARSIYGEALAPAFYGLRTTVVALVLFALLRIKRPEGLKEHSPPDLGRVLGLDRAPEVKTVHTKLARLAKLGLAERFGRELAQRRVAERGRMLGFLYVDGHVRVYHGKHKIPKTHVTRMRISLPGTTDYWVNDKRGDPLFVVTAEANAGMTKMLLEMTGELRGLLGPKRRATIVFDRGGFSPKLFKELLGRGFDILTYRKGRVRCISEKRFSTERARIDGEEVEYRLHDAHVRLLKGKLRLRQVTRLTDDGHQTPILTSREDLRAVEVAYRMFERWRQENFFKYMREEYEIDALAEHKVEPADPTRTVPNPARRALDKELSAARTSLAKLEEDYGAAAIDNPESKRRTMRGFNITHGKIGQAIRAARARVAELEQRRSAIPPRVPVAEALRGDPVVRLVRESKHVANLLKMVAYQVESDLLDLLRPHYARVDDEGRTLIQTALRSAAALAPSEARLAVTLAPLSSPHRSCSIAAVCRELNDRAVTFPGTSLVMSYAVAEGSS